MKQLELFEGENTYDAGATFDETGKYRFVLWRIWDNTLPKVMFIGLNPSTANEMEPDPTITRVKSFATQWSYGGFYMLNLFTYITPDPKQLSKTSTPKLLADVHLDLYINSVDKIIFAWGNFKQAQERAKEIIQRYPNAYCLLKNKNGSPRHPLYVKDGTIPIKF
jgi:hypothetical protein